MAVQVIPVNVRNSATGKIWFASEVMYGQLGRGDNPEEALTNLMESIKVILPAETPVFVIRSVDMNFPTAKSVTEFSEWMKNIHEWEASSAVR
ncbi:MAG: hypothetical protein OXN21_02415 [Chloroflexota bacterium]|nr:hypothetical protein [Chloroflexota bacterium]